MATDHIRYDILAQEALRGVVRTVLTDVAKKGLPGEHHFRITFKTDAPGVQLSERMRAQYPTEMAIVLQHQFWDLSVGDTSFEVGLSFGGVSEKVVVPFEALTAFFDPAVQFGLQFEYADAAADAAEKRAEKSTGEPAAKSDAKSDAKSGGKSDTKSGAKAGAKPGEKPAAPPLTPVKGEAKTEAGQPQPAAETETPRPDGGAEVVRLDRFRKK
jgi:uncharacterized protein